MQDTIQAKGINFGTLIEQTNSTLNVSQVYLNQANSKLDRNE